MMLIDTEPIVALFDASDNYHALCIETLKNMEGSLATTWAVLTEAFYLLDFSLKAQDNLWEFIIRDGMEIIVLDNKLQIRCRQLMEQYNDLPMDLADATLVAIAEHLKIENIFTLDHKDFNIYKPAKIKAFNILPASLT
jgi:predicted nucleic acid-binding protein